MVNDIIGKQDIVTIEDIPEKLNKDEDITVSTKTNTKGITFTKPTHEHIPGFELVIQQIKKFPKTKEQSANDLPIGSLRMLVDIFLWIPKDKKIM